VNPYNKADPESATFVLGGNVFGAHSARSVSLAALEGVVAAMPIAAMLADGEPVTLTVSYLRTAPEVGEVERLRAALDAIYLEANEGTDDAHRRLVNIMAMVAAALEGGER
jgi:hypothetical protein